MKYFIHFQNISMLLGDEHVAKVLPLPNITEE
jgi:hypothetical protein